MKTIATHDIINFLTFHFSMIWLLLFLFEAKKRGEENLLRRRTYYVAIQCLRNRKKKQMKTFKMPGDSWSSDSIKRQHWQYFNLNWERFVTRVDAQYKKRFTTIRDRFESHVRLGKADRKTVQQKENTARWHLTTEIIIIELNEKLSGPLKSIFPIYFRVSVWTTKIWPLLNVRWHNATSAIQTIWLVKHKQILFWNTWLKSSLISEQKNRLWYCNRRIFHFRNKSSQFDLM